MTLTSEDVEGVCTCIAYLGEESVVTGAHAAVIKHKENPKYLSYYFSSTLFKKEKNKIAFGTKVIEVKPVKLAEIKIPLQKSLESAMYQQNLTFPN